jgi:fusion protein PurCD
MPPVQDHKRANEGDQGPNTGGMGSYSCADHSLPFLKPEHVEEAQKVNERVGHALREQTGQPYQGVIYGGFILTQAGLRVIEYNARFGDPEVMNVLPIMQADFIDVCEAITRGTLNELSVRFERKSTVCKYVVPNGYPNSSSAGAQINVDAVRNLPNYGSNLRMYLGAVRSEGKNLCLTGSRAVALLGIGDTLSQAERIAEEAASAIEGPVYHRSDIGTAELVRRRVDHMGSLPLATQYRRMAI